MSVDTIVGEILKSDSFRDFRNKYRTSLDYQNENIADFELVSAGSKYRLRAEKLYFYDFGNTAEVMKDIESINKRLSVMIKFYSCQNLLKYQHDNFSMKCRLSESRSGMWYLLEISEHGVSVEQLIKENRFENTEKNILKLAVDVCKALKVLHDAGEPHMYIAPENIFLCDNGRYKLGRAAVVSDERRLTSSGMLYDGTYDRQSDIYMFGKCLSYIVSTLPGNMFSRRTGSTKISRIVERACDVDKYERYRNIDEVIQDIESISVNKKTPVYAISAAAVLVVAGIITAAAVSLGNDENIKTDTAEKNLNTEQIQTTSEFYGFNIKFGDVNNDGQIDPSDASQLLVVYSQVSTAGRKLSDVEIAVYDINSDGIIDSSDAGLILRYYSLKATGKTESFREFTDNRTK
ncbi:MAG: hypothetical protein IJ666_02415 [Ruminococcus sp.]|nr:hypothetical protein [Ruminococcus sp.]